MTQRQRAHLPGIIDYTSGVMIAPEQATPPRYWQWRIAAHVGEASYWKPAGTTPEDALSAALTFLVTRAELVQMLSELRQAGQLTLTELDRLLGVTPQPTTNERSE